MKSVSQDCILKSKMRESLTMDDMLKFRCNLYSSLLSTVVNPPSNARLRGLLATPTVTASYFPLALDAASADQGSYNITLDLISSCIK